MSPSESVSFRVIHDFTEDPDDWLATFQPDLQGYCTRNKINNLMSKLVLSGDGSLASMAGAAVLPHAISAAHRLPGETVGSDGQRPGNPSNAQATFLYGMLQQGGDLFAEAFRSGRN